MHTTILLVPAGVVYVFFVSTRDIKKGEELLLDYDIGELSQLEWWQGPYLEPVSWQNTVPLAAPHQECSCSRSQPMLRLDIPMAGHVFCSSFK